MRLKRTRDNGKDSREDDGEDCRIGDRNSVKVRIAVEMAVKVSIGG